jgi:hypothetical protein
LRFKPIPIFLKDAGQASCDFLYSAAGFADQIIDAEYKEVEADREQPAPPLVPSNQAATSTAREDGAVPTS